MDCLKLNVFSYIPDNVVNISIALPLGLVGGMSLIGCTVVSRLAIGPFSVVSIGWQVGVVRVSANEVANIDVTELGNAYLLYIV